MNATLHLSIPLPNDLREEFEGAIALGASWEAACRDVAERLLRTEGLPAKAEVDVDTHP